MLKGPYFSPNIFVDLKNDTLSYGMSFHCPLDDAQFESAVLRFAAAAVSARFGNDRPSAGDVPDAAPVDAPARARPARLGPRARTVS